MTTCIWDGDHTLYTDSLVLDYYVQHQKKHRILKNGNLVFGAGELFSLSKAWSILDSVNELNNFNLNKIDVGDDNNFTSVLVTKIKDLNKLKLYIFNKEMSLVEIPNQIVIIGSGYEYAQGAVAAGASPKEAIEIAIKYDSGSGGEINVFEYV